MTLINYLTALYTQLTDIETKGENTIKMTRALTLLTQIIEAIKQSEESASEPSPEESETFNGEISEV